MPIKIQVIGTDALEAAGKLSAQNADKLVEDLVIESRRFGFDAVAIAKKEYLSGPRPQRIKSEGLLKTRINTDTKREGKIINTNVGSDVVYARIQEKGGETHPNVTDRMRKFMWAMWYKTGDEKFKRLALTQKGRLTITIPARPYIEPAIEDAMPSFQENIARVMRNLNFIGAS